MGVGMKEDAQQWQQWTEWWEAKRARISDMEVADEALPFKPWVWAEGMSGGGGGVVTGKEPFALQLVLGKTITEKLGDAEAGHLMRSIKVGDLVRVSGRLQAQKPSSVSNPRPDQTDLIVSTLERISRVGDMLAEGRGAAVLQRLEQRERAPPRAWLPPPAAATRLPHPITTSSTPRWS